MFHLRRATAADAEALARIFLAARVSAFHWMDPARFHLADFEVQTGGESVYLAEDDDQAIVGFISVVGLESFIHHLYVDHGYRRMGVGRLLLESLRAWLPQPYHLKCLIPNQPAREFYQALGWTEDGRGSDDLGDYVLMKFRDPRG